MLDIGVTKLAIIGGIALIVIGPERLPSLARTLGTLMGRAQRYVADVKAEVNRSMELDELKKVKESVESASREVEQAIHSGTQDFETSWAEATEQVTGASPAATTELATSQPQYRHPRKNWRVKRAAVPQWYKARAGIRAKALSGAARVARFRPPVTGHHG